MTYYDQFEFSHNGYSKLFHFNSWRVATLEYVEEIDNSVINYLECHHETDEVFILLDGQCKMAFFKDNNPDAEAFEYINLQPHQIYRILKGVYHAHRISEDAKIVLIEEESTCDENSHRVYLTENQIKAIRS